MRSRAQRSSTLTENLHYCRNRSEMSMSEAESCDPPERYVHVASSATSSNLSIRMAETERLHAHSYVW